jgi:hypothetical protein
MVEIIDALSKSNSPALMVIIISVVFIAFMKEYLNAMIRLRELRQKREIIEENHERQIASNEISKPEIEKSSNVVDFNFKLLEKYYEQHLVEYKLMARSSLIVAILGFMVIVIGIFFTFANQVSIGVITSIAGLVSEAAALLFFKQNNLLIEQIREYHKKLVSTQYLLTGISLAGELPEQEAIFERRRIIGNLLFLSNELHGAKSTHLFSDSEGKSGGG